MVLETDLTDDEVSFLKKHGISVCDLFDGTGMNSKQIKEPMKSLGFVVAFNSVHCKKNGHRLRLRNGHCLQCKPEGLSYYKRFYEPAFLYIAVSCSKGLVKVGITNNIKRRQSTLRSYKYGGVDDWSIRKSEYVDNAGTFESSIHRALSKYIKKDAVYTRNGIDIVSREVFTCHYNIASSAFNKAIKGDHITVEVKKETETRPSEISKLVTDKPFMKEMVEIGERVNRERNGDNYGYTRRNGVISSCHAKIEPIAPITYEEAKQSIDKNYEESMSKLSANNKPEKVESKYPEQEDSTIFWICVFLVMAFLVKIALSY